HDYIKSCRVVILTYGTAFVYRRNDNHEIVANCHKMPSALFTKELLSAELILHSANETFDLLRKLNPEIRIITTVSPVRHTKDTLQLNSVSKSILRLCAHELQKSGIDYFPAYEIMMDDLRDYRFYKSDRIHPTEEAESYIIDKFGDQYFDRATKNLLVEWNTIRQALQHKPFQPTSSAHQTFLQKTLERLESIRHTIQVEEEITAIKSQLL
ncbi:MAG: GSCFA domain-containing protein, partial [Cyclobacteriaceae bacterium]|nr:GSCFA domain-containing protein [Cyclobacteriaceae bacterium]